MTDALRGSERPAMIHQVGSMKLKLTTYSSVITVGQGPSVHVEVATSELGIRTQACKLPDETSFVSGHIVCRRKAVQKTHA